MKKKVRWKGGKISLRSVEAQVLETNLCEVLGSLEGTKERKAIRKKEKEG